MSKVINQSLSFPAPEELLWVCPSCGPASCSRIAPSQVFRRNAACDERAGGQGSSEWRKIQCAGCEHKFMLRIDGEGWVTGLPIATPGLDAPLGKAAYSAVAGRAWATAG